MSKHDHARSALDDGLGVGEDGGDVHAAVEVAGERDRQVPVEHLHRALHRVLEGGGDADGGAEPVVLLVDLQVHFLLN